MFSIIHSVVSLLSQLKHILGLADQRASTFECVRLCSEGKILLTDEHQLSGHPWRNGRGSPNRGSCTLNILSDLESLQDKCNKRVFEFFLSFISFYF